MDNAGVTATLNRETRHAPEQRPRAQAPSPLVNSLRLRGLGKANGQTITGHRNPATIYGLRTSIERYFRSIKHSRLLNQHHHLGIDKVSLHIKISRLAHLATALAHLKADDHPGMRHMSKVSQSRCRPHRSRLEQSSERRYYCKPLECTAGARLYPMAIFGDAVNVMPRFGSDIISPVAQNPEPTVRTALPTWGAGALLTEVEQ